MTESVDGRREAALRAELLRRAAAVFGDRADAIAPGEIMHAILAVGARIGEEVTRRLEQIPQKQAANFYTAMGLGRAPAAPATLPVSITMTNPGPDKLFVPIGAKLQADAGGAPVIFQTLTGLDLARGAILRLCAVDLVQDSIFLAPDPALAPMLPYPDRIARRLASGVGAGATVLQIEPATGLASGAVLRIGGPGREAEHTATKVEGDLITIDPPLAAVFKAGELVVDVTDFSPWANGARNHQSHELYIGHSTLLDVPSAATIFVSGLVNDARMEWRWFGKSAGAEASAWQAFSAAGIDADGRWRLVKPAGKIEKTAVDGNSVFWLRVTLNEASPGVRTGQSIRLAVAADAACEMGEGVTRAPDIQSVDFEALAVTTPVVRGTPFHPFGREPRLYDSFYIGSREAFGKARAKVRLFFTLGGAALGRMAAVDGGVAKQIFAVGTDGLLYRAGLTDKSFAPVPMPPELKGAGVPSQAAVAARVDKGVVRIALAGKGCVFTSSFNALEKLAEGKITWQKLAPADLGGDAVSLHVASGDRVLALWQASGGAGGKTTSLIDWRLAQANAPQVTPNAVDLVPVQGADAALLIVADAKPGRLKLSAIHDVQGAPHEIHDFDAHQLPETMRAVFATRSGLAVGTYAIGGYAADERDGRRALQIVEVSPKGATPAFGKLGDYPPLPIAFEKPYDEGGWPVAVIATAEPRRIVASANRPPHHIYDGADIGVSANPMRHFVTFGGFTAVQHPDRGLYFRADDRDGHSLGSVALEGDYRLVADADVLPDGATLLVDKSHPHHKGFDVVELRGGGRLLRPFARKDAIPTPETEDHKWKAHLTPLGLDTGGGVLTVQGPTIELRDYDTRKTDKTALIIVESTIAHGVARSIWTLTRIGGRQFRKPRGFPSATAHLWRPLIEIGSQGAASHGQVGVTLSAQNTASWFEADAGKFEDLVRNNQTHPLYDDSITISARDAAPLGATIAFPLPLRVVDRHLDRNDVARFVTAASEWNVLGPTQPANPDLSWEYWNGSAWWALDPKKLGDTTADLQLDGDVSFTVPNDLAETDVGGRKNRWIRARLIGGDYGQARITLDTTGDDKHSTQSVTRDLSAIGAPYVTTLKITYCALEPRPPEAIVTKDNLGAIDQTNANDADLSVRFFSPVSAVVEATAPEAAETPGGDGVCCDVWADPTPAPPPPSTQAAFPRRALMIGFDQPPSGDAVSLYVDAASPGLAVGLTAFAFVGGSFVPIDIVADGSLGMSEPGAILLRIRQPLDLAQLLGASAYWIALGPAGDVAQWRPRIRGLHLNGVMAASVETRRNESIGSSTGAPDQRFRLVAAPVDPETLELWIAEPVGEEEARALGAEDAIEGVPGPWVRWTQTSELREGAPGRFYTLDALTGEVSFGNGRNALVPPMGGAILARTYLHVIGADANGVAAGAALQTVSPLAGVDKVIALDIARGGVDAESNDDALGRAPAKMRSGDRLITLADIEEFVLARLHWVAQARAANRRGRIRLVVAGRAEKLTPLPSALRGVRDRIAGNATFGVTDRIDVVAPRLLPLAVSVALAHDAHADIASLMARARVAIVGFLDHETGGYDGRGWPIGAAPVADDIAAALAEMAEDAAPRDIVITRKDTGAALPPALPGDVLARIAEADIAVLSIVEAAS